MISVVLKRRSGTCVVFHHTCPNNRDYDDYKAIIALYFKLAFAMTIRRSSPPDFVLSPIKTLHCTQGHK